MNATEAINKIKVLLGLDVETVKESFEATANLADGTPVHTPTEFEVGAMLHIIQEDGSMVPAPEGTHVLENGTSVSVDAAGVIVSMEEKAEEVEAEEVEETEEALSEEAEEETLEEEEVKEEAAMSAEDVVEAVVKALAPMMNEVEEMKAKLMSLSSDFETFSEAPAGKPVRNNFAEQIEAKKSKADALQAKLKEIRKQK